MVAEAAWAGAGDWVLLLYRFFDRTCELFRREPLRGERAGMTQHDPAAEHHPANEH